MGYNVYDENMLTPRKPTNPENLARWDPATRTWRDIKGNIVTEGMDDGPAWGEFLNYVKRKGRKLAHELDLDRHLQVQYNPQLPSKYLRQFSNTGPYSRPITAIDIETDDYGRPITISAIKTVQNLSTGEFEILDTYQRFYKSKGRDLQQTQSVHGLSPSNLNKLRRKQGASYPYTYNNVEENELRRFIGDSIIAGHNVIGFDIKQLFKGDVGSNQVIDTWHASVNAFGTLNPIMNGLVHNDLDSVFTRLFGYTMAQAGLPHHDSMSDTIAVALITQKLLLSKDTRVGSELNLMMNNPLLMYGPEESLLINKGNNEIRTGLFLGLHNSFDSPGGRELYYSALDEVMKQRPDLFNKNGVLKTILDNTNFENMIINGGGGSMDAITARLLQSTLNDLKDKLGVIQNAGSDILSFGSSMTMYKRGEWLRTLANVDVEDMPIVGKALGIEQGMMDNATQAARSMQHRRNWTKEFNELRSYYRRGLWDNPVVENMRKGMANDWSGWNGNHVAALNRDREIYEDIQSTKLYDRIEKSGLGKEDKAYLHNMQDLGNTYDEVNDALDTMIEKHQQLSKVYEAIGNIKPYDINQYINSARGQFQGIMGASRGVIPSFISNPIGRLGSAAFNAVDRSVAPWNAVSRTWNSGIGSVVEKAVPGGQLISGIINAGTQIYGNGMQAKMEMKGLEIQNTLNTLGAVTEWVTTPFRLLHKATKLLTGSFTGLSHALKTLMTSGLNDMGQMGNPLTELTGMNYSAYQGASMMDVASLLNRGSMNSIYENFASQQRALYTTGQMDQNRMISAAMLGVFGQAYTPTTDATGTYNSMANSILQRMSTQSDDEKARTMYLASLIDSNLPSVLRTANMLGVTDVNQFMNPRNRGMYWNPVTDSEERGMRWAQYEYGAFKEQWGTTKKRLAKGLWNAGGKDIYNGFAAMTDAIATGNWQGAIDQFTAMWTKFKDTVVGIWTGIKESLGEDTGSNILGFVKSGISTIGYYALEVCKKIISAWDEITLKIIDKTQGLVAYLSTIAIKPEWKNGRLSFGIESINSTVYDPKKDTMYWTDRGWTTGDAALSSLANQVLPRSKATHKKGAGTEVFTEASIRDHLYDLTGTWFDNEGNALREGISIPELHISNVRPQTRQEVDDLMNYIARAGSSGFGFRAAAAAYGYTPVHGSIDKGAIYADTGIASTAANLISTGENGIMYPIINGMQNQLKEQIITLDFKTNGKKIAAVSYEGGKKIAERGITNLENYVSKFLEIYAADSTQ